MKKWCFVCSMVFCVCTIFGANYLYEKHTAGVQRPLSWNITSSEENETGSVRRTSGLPDFKEPREKAVGRKCPKDGVGGSRR